MNSFFMNTANKRCNDKLYLYQTIVLISNVAPPDASLNTASNRSESIGRESFTAGLADRDNSCMHQNVCIVH